MHRRPPMPDVISSETVLEADKVTRLFDVSRPWLQRVLAREPRQTLRAVDEVSFAIAKGTTLSLVGESGCGKSTVARLAVGLYPPSSGSMRFEGANLSAARARPELRRRMNMIFQDPYASLNPRWRVRDIVAEPIRAFRILRSRRDVADRVGQLLEQVGLSARDGEKFPHEFSGGQRQRISIARALSSEPDFLVADEPTSALDHRVERLTQIEGSMPRLTAIPPGCPYNPRCPDVFDRCRVERPELMPALRTEAACWLYAEAEAHV